MLFIKQKIKMFREGNKNLLVLMIFQIKNRAIILQTIKSLVDSANNDDLAGFISLSQKETTLK